MFTGLIEELGIIKRLEKSGSAAHLYIFAKETMKEIKKGDSMAVNGVCLTITGFNNNEFRVDISPETLKVTNLGEIGPGYKVNLERPVRINDRLHGHMVSGHIDGVGRIKRIAKNSSSTLIYIEASKEILRLCIKKGSIAVDGISLTIVDIERDYFSVSLIPHTLKSTTLGIKTSGEKVNLENDFIAKYVERIIKGNSV